MAEILIEFAPKGDQDVLNAIKQVTRHVGDLKKIAKAPIDLNIVKNAMRPEDFNRLKAVIDRAKESTRDLGKEAMKAAKEQERLAASLNKMNSSRAGAGPIGGGAGNSMLTPANFSPAAVDGVQKNLKNLNGELDKTKTKAKAAGEGLGFVGRIIAAMAIRSFIHEVYDMANAFTAFQNKIKTVLKDQEDLGFVTKDLISIAQRSRSSLEAVGTMYARTSRAVQALGKSQFDTMKFTETLSKATAVGGSTSVEAGNAMIQLSQGMSSGTLKGDELRSVLEQLPIVAQLIADKMGVTVGSLRKLGSEGKLTTDVVFSAILDATGKIDAQFARMKPTMEQIVGVIKDKFMVAIGQSSGLLDKLSSALSYLSDNFDVAFKAAEALAGILAVLGAAKILSMVASIGLGFGGVAAAIGVATIAFVAFSDRIAASDDGVLKLSGASNAFWKTFTQDANDAKKVLEDFIGLFTGMPVKLGFSWDKMMDRLAMMTDMLRVMVNPELLIGGLLGDKESIKQAQRTQINLRRERAQAAGDVRTANGVKFEETNRKFNAFMKGNMASGEVPPTAAKKSGAKESGKTFDELIREATAQEGYSRLDDVEEKIRERLHKMTESLKPSIKRALDDIGGKGQIAAMEKEFTKEHSKESYLMNPEKEARDRKALNDKITGVKSGNKALLDEAAKLEEIVRIEMTRDHYRKLRLEEEKEAEKLLDKRLADMLKEEALIKKIGEEYTEARGDRRVSKEEGLQSTANSLDPNSGIRAEILKLQDFQKFAQDNHLANWAKVAKERIDDLRLSMQLGGDHFKTFRDQMNSIFGPGGTLVTGFADAAANAIVMSSSLKELKRSIVDVLNSVQKQAISSLIQLPLNAAMGALSGSAMSGSPDSSSLAGGGFRQVGASEASSWGLKSLDSGGYTGDMGTKETAGIVHGQEFVLNAEATRRMGKQNLDVINKGGSIASSKASEPKVVINNYAGVQVETNTLTPGQVDIMITRALQEKTGNIVAAHINDPNSKVSKSISKNVDSSRRRV